MNRLYVIALMGCIFNIAHAGTLYKCESSNGTVYQATPCPKNSKVTEFKRSSKDEPKTLCESASKAAESIMKARQNGADMAEMTNSLVSVQSAPEMKDLITAMINAAYEKPRFNSEDYQQRAVMDFKNENYLACTKAGLNNMK